MTAFAAYFSFLRSNKAGRIAGFLLTAVLVVFFLNAYFYVGGGLVIQFLVILFAVIALRQIRKERMTLRAVKVEFVVAAVAGSVVGHILLTRLHLSPVLAGSLCGTVAGLLCQARLRVFVPLAAPFYAGAFAGTGSPLILHGAPWVVLAGMLTGFFWSILLQVWSGIGGKLGFVGMFSAILSLWISEVILGMQAPDLPMDQFDWEHLLVVPVSGGFAFLTRRLIRKIEWHLILASAFPALLFAVTLYIFPFPLSKALSAAAFGGGFAGMTSIDRVKSDAWIFFSGILFGLVLLELQSPLIGCGGVLGATACTTVLSVMGVLQIRNRLSFRNAG